MLQANEPSIKKGSCSYCGDALINHPLYFLESLVTVSVDSRAVKLTKYVPGFVKDFVNCIPRFLFETFSVFKLVRFSSDINRANTFRSRVIWEEASRRGIVMEQVVFFSRPLDYYRFRHKGKKIYFESIPLRPESLDMSKNWDDKVVIKQEFAKRGIPVPSYFEVSSWRLRSSKKAEKIFSKLQKPIIVKPRIGSRG